MGFIAKAAVGLGVGLALLALGYFVGREVGRLEPIREQLRQARTEQPE